MGKATGSALTLIAGALILFRPPATDATQIYTNVTSQMGISVPGLGSGTAWADFDADGDQDLLVSDSDYPDHTYLYRNDGTVFTNVFASSGLTHEARNFAVGDYDADGLDDVAVISFGYVATKLFRNLGAMRFQDVSTAAGIYGTYSWRCAWVDYDDDGFLDLYLCGSTSYLFRNRGDGTFEERAAAAGIQAGGSTCAWLDYDNDGFEDCYVGRTGANRLYHNRGNGTFQDVAATAGVADPYDAEGVCAGDFDGDGFFDLYSVNIGSPRNTLYHNLGNGTFADITASAGVGDVGDGRTGTFLDIDYDGLVDLFSSNHVNPNRLYHNNGNATFTDIAASLNLRNPYDPFGTGFADFDNDGDLDVFLATHFGNQLLRCDGLTRHWTQLHLVGTVSNRSAIGAVVRCTAAGRTAYARVDGGHGMGDMDSAPLEFGLGESAGPFEIVVYWPSGSVEAYPGLPADQQLELVEGGGASVPALGDRPSAGLTILGLGPNPAIEACTLTLRTTLRATDRTCVTMVDPAGRVAWSESTVPDGSVTTLALPIRGLGAGTYFVRIISGGETARARLTIVR